jgi:NAD(P)-dependent dehydrogenase (short-subunit alcohol dehydrogenase family)
MSQLLEGKVALITGGTSGIGRATAVAFAREGATVVVSGRREKEGQETVQLVLAIGGHARFVAADVSDEKQVAALVDKVVATFGRLDVAFNNAGIEGVPAPISDATAAQYNQIFDINVKGVFLSMKYEIPAMLKTGGGAIVNTASVLGSVAVPGFGLYSATKHAVLGLTKAAALEVAGQGLRINAVSPAAIETDMVKRTFGNDSESPERKHLAAAHPVGRLGLPEEIASAVVYLCSPQASFVTGTDLHVDGGTLAKLPL